MKRYISIALVLLLLSAAVSAHADTPQISGKLFSTAKQALVYLASGEYERLVTLLPFSDVSPSAAEWHDFAEGNFSTLHSGVQTEYSVAYWNGSCWKVAVPVAPPGDGNVEALVLTSADGKAFSGYRYSNWSNVCSEYESASYVTWNKEYIGSEPMIVVD